MTNLQLMAKYELSQAERAERLKSSTHEWITVVNPTNSRVLLQACDFCGVVKSENSVVSHCSNAHGERLISSSLGDDLRLAV
ncbi:MAG: hypothetical protein AAF431_03260 [Pseudomonadota bacterium]